MAGPSTAGGELAFLSAVGLGRQLRAGEVSAEAIADALLDRIARFDPRLNAFRLALPERALAEARAADLELGSGKDRGPLHGIPYAIKDVFDVRGVPTSAGSDLLDAAATQDATVVTRAAAAGMVLLGKTNLVELSFGAPGINHRHGTPHNPWAAAPHVPGGSSSGSAVAVAAGLVPIAFGSDTGASVRTPAALCGIVGFKPGSARVSRAGVFPYSWSMDGIGYLARSVQDTTLIYAATHGPDPTDPRTLAVPPHDVLPALGAGVGGLRLAFAETVFFDDADSEVEEAVRACGPVLEDLGARVESIALPEAEAAHALLGIIPRVEGFVSNERLLAEHAGEIDPIVASRLEEAGRTPASDYAKALRETERLRASIGRSLGDIDALLVPTVPICAAPLCDVDASFERYRAYARLYARNGAIGNQLDLPAISVPCGCTRGGLPIGLMIYARPLREDLVLRVAHAYEQATSWHRRVPDLGWAVT